MAYVAVDEDGTEAVFEKKPFRGKKQWGTPSWDVYDDNAFYDFVVLPKGTIKKIIGRELSWQEEPIKLMEDKV